MIGKGMVYNEEGGLGYFLCYIRRNKIYELNEDIEGFQFRSLIS